MQHVSRPEISCSHQRDGKESMKSCEAYQGKNDRMGVNDGYIHPSSQFNSTPLFLVSLFFLSS